VQRELREIPGVTVIIYDQTCAAEKRRRRKRGTYPDPDQRVFINEAVCEGCGDCSTQSNCLSVEPVETEFGRKRHIDQSSCNKDFPASTASAPASSPCTAPKPRKKRGPARRRRFPPLPSPPAGAGRAPYNILVTGVGGTGVTIGALIGMAAHLEGKGASGARHDRPRPEGRRGLQPYPHRRSPSEIAAVRIAAGGADLLLGCDMLVAASTDGRCSPRSTAAVTHAVINTAEPSPPNSSRTPT
jgi:indolepyruvate ferredoxin oxidoreductase